MARPKNYQRDEVIQQALELFWRKGFAATSLSDLTEATGLNKRSLYNEFGSKEELFQVCMAYYRQLRAPMIKMLERQPVGITNIHKLLRALAEGMDCRGCLLVLSLHEIELLSDDARTVVKDSFAGFQTLLEMNLAACSLPEGIEAKALARILSMQMLSVAGMGKLGLPSSDIQAAIEQLIRLLPCAE